MSRKIIRKKSKKSRLRRRRKSRKYKAVSSHACARRRWQVDKVYSVNKLENIRSWSGDGKHLEESLVQISIPDEDSFTTNVVEKNCKFEELLSTFALQRHVESLSIACDCFPVPLMSSDDRKRIAIHQKILMPPDRQSETFRKELVNFVNSIPTYEDDEDDEEDKDNMSSFSLESVIDDWIAKKHTRVFTSVTPLRWINLTYPYDFKPELLYKLLTTYNAVRQSFLQQLGRCVTIMENVVFHRDWNLKNVPICTPGSQECTEVKVAIVDFEFSDVHNKSVWTKMMNDKENRLRQSQGQVRKILDEINIRMQEVRHKEIVWSVKDEKWYSDAIKATVDEVFAQFKNGSCVYPLESIPVSWQGVK